nr:hypothetical protein Iba_chr02aCG23360 [Ipomoea batatas]
MGFPKHGAFGSISPSVPAPTEVPFAKPVPFRFRTPSRKVPFPFRTSGTGKVPFPFWTPPQKDPFRTSRKVPFPSGFQTPRKVPFPSGESPNWSTRTLEMPSELLECIGDGHSHPPTPQQGHFILWRYECCNTYSSLLLVDNSAVLNALIHPIAPGLEEQFYLEPSSFVLDLEGTDLVILQK